MYVLQREALVSLRAIAMLVALALLMWTLGFNALTKEAEAANITSASDTLSDSNPTSASNHTIAFTTPNGVATGTTFTITLPGTFGMGSIVIGDVDLSVNAADQTLAGAAGAGTWGVTGFGGNTLTFETPTDGGTASSAALIVLIGDNASGGTNQITNPSATTTSYQIDIAGTMTDSGHMRVAIVDNVLVTAQVNTTLQFVVYGTTTGITVNGSATSTFADSSHNALPFGVLSAGTSKVLAQDLTVVTNAINGYVVTVYMDDELRSTTGAIIDSFVDGNYTQTPQSWATPTNSIVDDTTWGHWGITSTDFTANRASEFSSDAWVGASTTPINIMYHSGPADGVTPGTGYATIGYQIQITALQEAGDDYNTTLTYIATPTF